MQFNKSKFNSGRFNTSESKTVACKIDFLCSSELLAIPTRITFSRMLLIGSSSASPEGYRTTHISLNIISYGDIASNSVKAIVADGHLCGDGKLISNVIEELFASSAFSGTSDIVARLEEKGIATAKVKIDGVGSLLSKSYVILNAKPLIGGLSDVLALIKRNTPLTITISSKGDLIPETIVIKYSKLSLDGKGEIQIKVTKIIISAADIYGYGDMGALLSKIFTLNTSIRGHSNIRLTAQREAILNANFNGLSEVITIPYFIYKPPHIILPTKVLIEDTSTKAVIL